MMMASVGQKLSMTVDRVKNKVVGFGKEITEANPPRLEIYPKFQFWRRCFLSL
jgi:hypothetical protein